MRYAVLARLNERLRHTPHGTVSYYADPAAGYLAVFSELEPHEDDWQLAMDQMAAWCDPGDPVREFYAEGVLVFVKRLKAGLACVELRSVPDREPTPPAGIRLCPDLCEHLGDHAAWCPRPYRPAAEQRPVKGKPGRLVKRAAFATTAAGLAASLAVFPFRF